MKATGTKRKWWLRFLRYEPEAIIERCYELLNAIYPDAPLKAQASGSKLRGIKAARIILERLGTNTDLLDAPETESRVTAKLRVLLIRHGQVCCKSEEPECVACPLISFCRYGMERVAKYPHDRPIAIDMFAGAGALSAGFQEEGFRVALAVEKDKDAAQSYRINNPGVPVLEIDARRVRPSDVLAACGMKRGRVAAVIGGAPCQGYSAAGARRPKVVMNELYSYLAKMASGVGASYLIMENVPGLKKVGGVDFKTRIIRCFKSRGFRAEAYDIDASKFGVPQRRHRMIFMCPSRDLGILPEAPQPRIGIRAKTVARVLEGLPSPTMSNGSSTVRKNGKNYYNHRAMRHSARVVRKIRGIEPGGGPISYRRLRLDLAQTIIAGHRAMPVHPRRHRTITVREAARIQTLPDSFRFLGSHAEQPLQVANVVPYLLARSMARTALNGLKAHLRGRHV